MITKYHTSAKPILFGCIYTKIKMSEEMFLVENFDRKFLAKCLVAQTAAERSYILVHSHVNNQVVGFGKCFATDFSVFKYPVASFIVANIFG